MTMTEVPGNGYVRPEHIIHIGEVGGDPSWRRFTITLSCGMELAVSARDVPGRDITQFRESFIDAVARRGNGAGKQAGDA